MEIFAIKGHKVKVTNQTKNYGYRYDRKLIDKYLKIDTIYTVDYTDINHESSHVYLIEFPNIAFNCVNFVDIETQDINKTKLHKQYKNWNE